MWGREGARTIEREEVVRLKRVAQVKDHSEGDEILWTVPER